MSRPNSQQNYPRSLYTTLSYKPLSKALTKALSTFVHNPTIPISSCRRRLPCSHCAWRLCATSRGRIWPGEPSARGTWVMRTAHALGTMHRSLPGVLEPSHAAPAAAGGDSGGWVSARHTGCSQTGAGAAAVVCPGPSAPSNDWIQGYFTLKIYHEYSLQGDKRIAWQATHTEYSWC